MDLLSFINAKRGNASALAEKMGVSLSYLSQMAAGTSAISPERCVLIEQETSMQVTRRDLRPDDWDRIWPELIAAKPRKVAA